MNNYYHNVETSHGKNNSAIRIWLDDNSGLKWNQGTWAPTTGTVIETDQGAMYQLNPSHWVINGWEGVTSSGRAYDGIRVRQIGRVFRTDGGHNLGTAVRVEITFVGDGEADTVTKGWMKV